MLLLPKPVRQPRRNRTESIARAISAPDRYHLERAGEWIEQLYRAWGKPDQAAEWAQNLPPGKIAAAPKQP